MYTKNFIPLSDEDIKKVNASALAESFEVSQSYISRVLKSEKPPTSETAIQVYNKALEIIKAYNTSNNENQDSDSISQ